LLHFEPTIQLEGERNNEEEVGLEWKTTNASQGLYFDVERSLGDTTHFEKVNFVWSLRGGIKEKYQLPDNNDHETLSYYRVKLQLNDGRNKYSNLVAVKGMARNLFGIYPNPASSNCRLTVFSREPGQAKVTLFSAQGENLIQRFISFNTGINQEEINIEKLPAGMYMIQVILPDKQIRTGRIIKI
jgi:hypothetical protein